MFVSPQTLFILNRQCLCLHKHYSFSSFSLLLCVSVWGIFFNRKGLNGFAMVAKDFEHTCFWRKPYFPICISSAKNRNCCSRFLPRVAPDSYRDYSGLPIFDPFRIISPPMTVLPNHYSFSIINSLLFSSECSGVNKILTQRYWQLFFYLKKGTTSSPTLILSPLSKSIFCPNITLWSKVL